MTRPLADTNLRETDATQQIRILGKQRGGWSTETEDIFAVTDLSPIYSRSQDVLDFIA